jgi:putative copper resistance protein D
MASEGILILARWVHFTAAMILFGASLFPFYAIKPPARRGAGALERRTRVIVAATALLALLVWVGCLIAQLADDLTVSGLLDTAEGVFLETDFGRVLLVRLALALVALAMAAVPDGDALVLGPAALLLISEAWIGHAAMGQGWGRLAAQSVHLLAGGAWIGGLVPLGVIVRRAWRTREPDAVRLARAALMRFSDLGVGAVAAVIATGALNTAVLVGAPEGFTSAYGEVLIVKILLVLAMVALATVNRLYLMPRLGLEARASAPILRGLSRNILVEQGLGILVLAAVSVLGVINPGAMS